MKEYDYSLAGAYFVTICTYHRERLLGEIKNCKMDLSPVGQIVEEYWRRIMGHFTNVALDEFVIMPNHMHGIICLVGAIHELPLQHKAKNISLNSIIMRRRKMTIPKIVGYFKMNSAKAVNQFRNTIGSPFWQRNYYEHIIRDENDLNSIREYIIINPVKWHVDPENPIFIKDNSLQ